jgi:hypothetical protein
MIVLNKLSFKFKKYYKYKLRNSIISKSENFKLYNIIEENNMNI